MVPLFSKVSLPGCCVAEVGCLRDWCVHEGCFGSVLGRGGGDKCPEGLTDAGAVGKSSLEGGFGWVMGKWEQNQSGKCPEGLTDAGAAGNFSLEGGFG